MHTHWLSYLFIIPIRKVCSGILSIAVSLNYDRLYVGMIADILLLDEARSRWAMTRPPCKALGFGLDLEARLKYSSARWYANQTVMIVHIDT